MTQACDIRAMQEDRPAVGSAMAGVQKGYHLAVLLVCGAVLLCAAAMRAGGDGLSLFGYRWPLSCWLHDTLGVKCGLCGMSRSFSALAHGDISAGVQFHRLGPAVFALFCLQVPYRFYALVAGPKRLNAKLVRFHVGLVVLLCAVLLANWFVYLGGLLL